MKKISVILTVLLVLSMVLCACADSTPSETTPSATGATTPQIPTKPAGEMDSKVTYTVIVLDDQGIPVQGVKIQFCDEESCRIPVTTGADGKVTPRYDAADYHITLTAIPEGYAAEKTEFYFEGSTEITVTLTRQSAAQ